MKSPIMTPSVFLGLALFLTHRTPTCSGFNIDDRFPVIKEGPTAGSFFGLSVAQHQQTEGSVRPLLLIGAPKEKAVGIQNVKETGAVYFCPVTPESTDCSRMQLISSTDPSDMVEGMWLGVTVASQRDHQASRVLACGHRFVKIRTGQRRMIGKCYVRGNDLSYDPDDIWQLHSYELCDPGFDHVQEGMCNLGISGGITETDVYFGSPGSFDWQGNVHAVWRNPVEEWQQSERKFEQLNNKRNSYRGYSVLEEKKLLSSDSYTVVTGSPRNESKGSVMFARGKGSSLIPELVIPGKQVGSYFGSSLAAIDLNNDNWNDLLVGAPFYFNREKDEGGAVYIFLNENGSFQKTATMVLMGPANSAFGIAVAAVGDVNQDGFQDFAVGAPFHDAGKVYIWMGSKKGISQNPSQVIEGKSVGKEGFKTFGYSINGGLDMDDNQYPDILVGSLDDRIALLRARPVVHLTKTINVEPKIVDPNQCLENEACIKATICMSYTLSNGNKDFKKDIVVKYTVVADVDRRRSPRVRFLNSRDETAFLTLPSTERQCRELDLTVVAPVREKLEPVVFNLNVSLHEQIDPPGHSLQNLDSLPVFSQKQKLSQRTEINFKKACGSDNKCTSNLQLKAHFADDQENPFPRDDAVQVLQFNSSVKKILLMVEVTNLPAPGKLAEDAHQAALNITIPDALRYSAVRSQNHDVECIFDDTVICELGNPLKSKERVFMRLILETTGINLHTEEVTSLLLLSTVSEQSDLNPVPVVLMIENTILTSFSIEQPRIQTYFSGMVMGESAMVNTTDVGSLVELTFNVVILGQPLGDLGILMVDFHWPFEIANGKWLLYLTEIIMTGTSETHCVPPGDVVNLLNLTLPVSRAKRTKREVKVDDVEKTKSRATNLQAAVTLGASRKHTYLLECSTGTARCVTFTCPLHNMTSSAKITVRSRVWNSTMLEDYSRAVSVEVRGEAALRLINHDPNIKMENQNATFKVDITPELREEAPYQVPLWIIITAAASGILLLGIIILILWKCGFFRRANRRVMYEKKDEKAVKKIQPSETDRLTEDS
ncbi:integrin alpha-3b isoform X2 [Thalassophryne amazonica]|uniref:integrin alpha-3b isoform X2 n=1 Tax=Thalassophryne amazonica TaxID=390379 RepID=UPI001470B2DF|nr:integrin alpha-3b isoform X2 [Thalassophryne amazonica]